jgi:hypothetical protein
MSEPSASPSWPPCEDRTAGPSCTELRLDGSLESGAGVAGTAWRGGVLIRSCVDARPGVGLNKKPLAPPRRHRRIGASERANVVPGLCWLCSFARSPAARG